MVLTLHHLQTSQSERITFLLAELHLPYTLITHARDPQTGLSPPSLKAIHPAGTAPVLIDDAPPSRASLPADRPKDAIVLAESGAIVEYIIHTYAGGRLSKAPGDPEYADYLLYFHFANGTLMPAFSRNLVLSRVPGGPSSSVAPFVTTKLHKSLEQVERRLAEAKYLAGDEFTAADIMNVFCLTTMRGFFPVEGFDKFHNILRWLSDIGRREGYREAMKKGDPELEPMLGAVVKKITWGGGK